MTVLIPTVKHNGSHLVLQAFLDWDWEQQPAKKTKLGEKVVVMDHVIYTKLVRLQEIAAKSDTVVIPIRHPLVAALSWQRLGEELEPDFYQMYTDLERFVEGALLLPLGIDDNTQYVAAIEAATGVRINTDTIEGSRAGTSEIRFDSELLRTELKEHQKIARFAQSLRYIQDIYDPKETAESPAQPQKACSQEVAEEINKVLKPAEAKAKARPKKKAVKKKSPGRPKKEVIAPVKEEAVAGVQQVDQGETC